MKRIDDKAYVSGQISPDKVAELASVGVTMIINNRPDGEEAGQPSSDEVAAAAEAAGIGYRHIPIAGAFPEQAVSAMNEALEATDGRVVAYCRSGARSAFLWGLARGQAGYGRAWILQQTAAAGFDLSPIRQYLPISPAGADEGGDPAS